MKLIVASYAISLLAILVSLTSAYTIRRQAKTTARSSQPRTAPRHAIVVIQHPAGHRPAPTPITRERIPLQVPPEVDAAHSHIIDAYGVSDDDLLMRPPFAAARAAGDTAVTTAVP